ncbi:unnamed protein product [Ambrosiozyma monospora]|uniref:Unnamed protein product n=1 Tax=Ambrosiozyma monospora TaxID=43982 RepID=A0A9W6T788_AMBMO|nr:unnamed protein product [Ambrosiozyma monospora]
MKKNEKLTPYLIAEDEEAGDGDKHVLETQQQRQQQLDANRHIRQLSSFATLGANLTPTSGVTLASGPQHRQSSQFGGPDNLEDFDSDDESSNDIQPQFKLLRKSNAVHSSIPAITVSSNSMLKDSKLNRFKNSKKLQTLLHSSANYYQQQQQAELRNISGNPSMPDMTSYHRWTVWRKQQMSFKGKHPRSLAVDGWQIYILPFNEVRGSWYESKTSTFNISQVLKAKQNAKVPKYFKLIVNKTDAVKKYYLEATSVQECKEIVNTIRGLMAAYHREQSEQRGM